MAGFPGPVAITDAKADTAHLFEENILRVFGLAFDDIDLAEVVQHDQTRAHLKTAAQLDSQGSRLEAMGTLAVAFEDLMDAQIHDEDAPRRMSVYSFGERLTRPILRTDQVHAILRQPDHGSRTGVPVRGAQGLANEYTHTRDVTRALQEGMRLMALGVDFHGEQFLRVVLGALSLLSLPLATAVQHPKLRRTEHFVGELLTSRSGPPRQPAGGPPGAAARACR
ncbi:hypothetical protein [Streptomyces sp. SA15]|uniref:hypothetical protein n=1 Tax=Streptomyces sp. SA15 TaxID=934019 RepID=UPI00117FACE0|nr:hypothetical protein [Streptomyces sp. SA15]